MERDNLINHIFRITQISTHTLTWSVTRLKILQGLNENFNSHAHVERDKKAYNEMTDDENFNSHAHVERD